MPNQTKSLANPESLSTKKENDRIITATLKQDGRCLTEMAEAGGNSTLSYSQAGATIPDVSSGCQ